jgi:hypothetical protein
MSRLGRDFMNGNRFEFCYDDGNECLGSDGVSPADGRLGLYRLIEEGRKRLKSIKNIKPSLTGLTIYKRGQCIYSNRWEIV